MTISLSRSRPQRVNQIAKDVFQLLEQQMDTLRQGLSEARLGPYLQRTKQIEELKAELTTLRRQPS
jgi:hypothetical protein